MTLSSGMPDLKSPSRGVDRDLALLVPHGCCLLIGALLLSCLDWSIGSPLQAPRRTEWHPSAMMQAIGNVSFVKCVVYVHGYAVKRFGGGRD